MKENISREKAFEILQLDPSTPTDKIKQKYENFMRRAKFDKNFDEVEITKAYDTIMGLSWGNFEADPDYSAKGLNKKKIVSFFYLNKRSLMYGGAAFILIISIIIMVITGTAKYDYKISVLGNVAFEDQELMGEYYEDLLDKENVLIDYYKVGSSEDARMGSAFMFKLGGDVAKGESNLFIVHKGYSEFLSNEGALLDLTPYLDDLGISPDDKNLIYWNDHDGSQIACAFKFDGTSIFNEGMNGVIPKYIAIPCHTEYSEDTKTVILDLLSQGR